MKQNRYGLSQAVPRREDPRLLCGRGRFTDDAAAGAAAVHALVLRSPLARGRIRVLDIGRARAAAGVLAVFTADDIRAAGLERIAPLGAPEPRPGTRLQSRPQPLLADGEVSFVGEGVAFIVAETLGQAQDAAEQIELQIDPLPVLADTAALAADQRRLGFDWELGDSAATEAAFAAAAHVVALELCNQRVAPAPLETRSVLAEAVADGRLKLTTNTQMPHPLRAQLAQVFGRPEGDFRVCVDDVGGGFGARNSLYPEQALALFAASRLARPVRWTAERGESLLADFAGRDNVSRAQLALDGAGRFLGLRVLTLASLGGYSASRGHVSPINVAMASNCYRIGAIHISVKALFGDTVPTDPYRGAGRPEILYLVERLVDVAARELGLDRLELRRRNFIPPPDFPYTTPTGLCYERCDFSRTLDRALARADWPGFAARRSDSHRRGRLRGIGLACYVERCGGGGGLAEHASLSFDRDGVVELRIGSMSNGQGHETAYSQILASRLGLDFDRIRVVQGDTDRVGSGLGTGGSWSIPMGGGAVCVAADALLERGRSLAAKHFEAAAADIEYSSQSGSFRVIGTDRELRLTDLATRCGGDLAGQGRFAPDNYTFPYGCHICEAEVDPETGAVSVLGYTAVHDFGVALNPALLAGQVHGGLAQGLGQALLERLVYDDSGQPLCATLSDYALPRADELPAFDFVHLAAPSGANPLGVKGCGEAGAAGSPPALVNAVADALRVRHIDMPLTPETVWRALRSRDASA